MIFLITGADINMNMCMKIDDEMYILDENGGSSSVACDDAVRYIVDWLPKNKILVIREFSQHLAMEVTNSNSINISFSCKDEFREFLQIMPGGELLYIKDIPMSTLKGIEHIFLSKSPKILCWSTDVYDPEMTKLLIESGNLHSVTYFPEMYDMCIEYPNIGYRCDQESLMLINPGVKIIILEHIISDKMLKTLSKRIDKDTLICAANAAKVIKLNKFSFIRSYEPVPKDILDQNSTVVDGNIPTDEQGYDQIIFRRNRNKKNTKNANNIV